jgi:Kdo2-lipid IVA lauroyltransferase/acyltransferase
VNTTNITQRVLTWVVRRSLDNLARTPREKILRRGERLGRIAYHLPPLRKYQRMGVQNLKLVYGDKYTPPEREAHTKAVFEHMGRLVLDFLRMQRFSPIETSKLIETVTGWEENFLPAYAQGKGIIFVSGHFGNWEMLARHATTCNIPLTVIGRDPREGSTKDFLKEVRESGGYKVVGRGTSAARHLLRALRNGETISILPDQNSGDYFVPFFGIPAGTVASPATMAFKTGATLLPLGSYYCPETQKYRIEIHPPIDTTQTGDANADVYRVLCDMNAIIETMIKKEPKQWLWIHDRWKSAFEEDNLAKWPDGYDYEAIKKRLG